MAVENTDNRIKHNGDGTTTTFPFPFFCLDQDDLRVSTIVRSTGVETVKTLTTDYTVTLNEDAEGGSITFVSAPASTADVLIVNDLDETNEVELTTLGGIPSGTISRALDRLHLLVIKANEKIGRALKFPIASSSADAEIPEPSEGKALKWTADGDLENSTYDPDEVVEEAEGHAEDAAASATAAASSATSSANSATASAASATTSSNWATKTDGDVSGGEQSSKAYAIGGTGVTATAGKGAAKEWATKTSDTVDGTEFSAKEYSQGTQAGTGGSAKDWAQKTSAAVTAALYSAKEWAIGVLTRGTSGGGSAKDWATYTGGTVDDTERSAKYYAQQAASAAASASTYRWGGTAAGTADALTITPSPALASYDIGTNIKFLASATNTGAATINVNGLGAKSLKTQSGAALAAGDITSGRVYTITYDGTNFTVVELATPEAGSVTATKLAAEAVETAKIKDANVTRVKLATGAVAKVTMTGSKTGAYTATSSDDVIPCNASGGAFTVTLPAASGLSGMILTIVKTDSSFNAVTIDGNASETINGATTTTLNTQYESVQIVCDGSNWFIVTRQIPSNWTSFTPTGSWSANTTYFGQWRRVRDTIEIDYYLATSGAPTSATLTLNLVSGLSIDSAKLAAGTSSSALSNYGWILDSGTAQFTAGATYNNTTSFFLAAAGGSGYGSITQAYPMTWASGDRLSIRIVAPISGWNG